MSGRWKPMHGCMRMRRAMLATLRRGPARCPWACWAVRWSAAHAWGGSGTRRGCGMCVSVVGV
eukprot:4712019-Prymnesium_polylepis.1